MDEKNIILLNWGSNEKLLFLSHDTVNGLVVEQSKHVLLFHLLF